MSIVTIIVQNPYLANREFAYTVRRINGRKPEREDRRLTLANNLKPSINHFTFSDVVNDSRNVAPRK
jgi:hypothetical protein